MVYFVCVLSLLSLLLIRFVLQHFNAFSSACLILAGLGHRVQLPYLILREMGRQRRPAEFKTKSGVLLKMQAEQKWTYCTCNILRLQLLSKLNHTETAVWKPELTIQLQLQSCLQTTLAACHINSSHFQQKLFCLSSCPRPNNSTYNWTQNHVYSKTQQARLLNSTVKQHWERCDLKKIIKKSVLMSLN